MTLRKITNDTRQFVADNWTQVGLLYRLVGLLYIVGPNTNTSYSIIHPSKVIMNIFYTFEETR